MPTSAYRAIYNIAEDQMGYVTTVQAGAAGVSAMVLVMMTRRGTLNRVSRGVYRLVDFPTRPLAQHMQATLWPYGRRGVLSHGTALSLHGLCKVDLARVHITVPVGFRIQRTIPDYLFVHHGTLAGREVTQLEGMPITTPVRTIRDCIQAHMGRVLVKHAIGKARKVGILDASAAAALGRELRAASSGVTGIMARK